MHPLVATRECLSMGYEYLVCGFFVSSLILHSLTNKTQGLNLGKLASTDLVTQLQEPINSGSWLPYSARPGGNPKSGRDV